MEYSARGAPVRDVNKAAFCACIGRNVSRHWLPVNRDIERRASETCLALDGSLRPRFLLGADGECEPKRVVRNVDTVQENHLVRCSPEVVRHWRVVSRCRRRVRGATMMMDGALRVAAR